MKSWPGVGLNYKGKKLPLNTQDKRQYYNEIIKILQWKT